LVVQSVQLGAGLTWAAKGRSGGQVP